MVVSFQQGYKRIWIDQFERGPIIERNSKSDGLT
jgi:hypothetical protein